jgi:hypothetical protein
MILGTYWYFGFPTGLYQFDYFEFKQGYGGHADNPAELVTCIETDNPEKLIADLRSLIDIYKEGFIFIYQDGHRLKIGTGAHQLYDYDFLLMLEIEKILKSRHVQLCTHNKLNNPTLTRLFNENASERIVYPSKSFLQVVGSDLKKYHAENSKFRIDCHIDLENKSNYIADLKKTAQEENLQIFFYKDNDFGNTSNLMLFFSNGRQGLNLVKKQVINVRSFEDKVEAIMKKYQVKTGHLNSSDHYPQNGPVIEMMIEEEFVL